MNNKKAQSILIVGGGIGGLSTAIALRQQGFDVELIELNPEWTVYGVGIIQQGNVVREMARLGVANDCMKQGFSFDKVRLCDGAGNPLAVIPGARVAGPDYPVNMALPRISLHTILLNKATELGTKITLGLTVDSLENGENKALVKFSDGGDGEYDLVIGADGIFSKIRGLLFGTHLKPKFTGQGGWRCNMPRMQEIDCLTMYRGKNGGQAGFCPLTNDLMYLLQTTSEPGNPWFDQDKLDVLFKERLTEFEGPVARARDEFITNPKQVIYKPFETIFLEAPWYQGRFVLIGDAAHATTPHLGQGAGMAIEDGIVLAEELKAKSVDQALESFMTRRFERCKFIVNSSLQIGTWELERNHTADFNGLVQKMVEVTAQPI
jgi:2-polyprenyl-6-methoxyphenol hydroxylase-like FAD-dependent oxidoreductase